MEGKFKAIFFLHTEDVLSYVVIKAFTLTVLILVQHMLKINRFPLKI